MPAAALGDRACRRLQVRPSTNSWHIFITTKGRFVYGLVRPTVAYGTRMPSSTRRPRSRSPSLGTVREDRCHLVDALFQPTLREIAGVFGGVTMLDDDHLRPTVVKIVEGHQVLTVIRYSWPHAKISRHQPIAVLIGKVEQVGDS